MSRKVTVSLGLENFSARDLKTIEELVHLLSREKMIPRSTTILEKNRLQVTSEGEGTIVFRDDNTVEMWEEHADNSVYPLIREFYPLYKTAKDILEDAGVEPEAITIGKEGLLIEMEV